MSLTRKVAYNTVVQVVGKVITTLISLYLVAALTRYLGVSGYGQYTTIFAFVGFFSVVADFGFFWILVREMAKPDSDIKKVVSHILTLRTFLGIVVYGLCFLTGFFIPQYADFRAGIGIVALASLWLALNSTYVGVFQNKLRMDKAVITDILGRLIILGMTLYLIKLNLGLNAVLWAYAIGNVINFFASAFLGRMYVNFRPAFDYGYWKEIFFQALPMGIALIFHLIYFKIDTVMLSLMRTSEDVGIYGPPYKVLEILTLIPSMFMGNVFPIVTRFIYEKNERIERILQKSFDFLFLAAVPIVLGIIFTSERIIRIVAGQDFVVAHTIGPVWGMPATSPTVLQILVVAVGISFLSNMFGYLVIALGKQSKLVAPYAFLALFNVGLNLILIPKISYIGAAIATVLTEILVLIFSWRIASRNLKIKLRLTIIWQVLFASLILGVFLYFLAAKIHLLILIPVAVIIYGAALYLVGGINKDMVLELLPRRNRENSD